ncbi:MAG: FAD-dependent oxidoreductase [Eubacteriales bacterium]|nr:FAD-dependent oxidoreductase [Eubacteriales bacterium]
MKKLHYDAVIIGFGKGGKTLAGKLAGAGKTVALVEMDSEMYGGTCINVGCIPSKSLIVSAAGADPAASESEKAAYYRESVEQKRRLTASLRKKNFDKLDHLPNVTIYNGRARFAAPLQVEVTAADETYLLDAGQVFLNTGSTARIPPIEGVHDTPGVFTSAGLLDLDALPARLAVIGGGYIGLEFASMFAGFGSEVTVLQDGGTFLPREDEDIAAAIRALLEKRGVRFLLNAQTERIASGAHGGPSLTISRDGRTETLDADAVLVATGRVPNTEGLNCEAAGVELTPRGAVKVDERLRTTAPNVWAMGDVTGGLQHTYVSLDDFRVVWSQLAGDGGYTTADRKNVPYSVFLATPYSRVGMNEREALAAGLPVRVLRLSAAAIPKAQVLRAPEGVLKAVVHAETGKILGAMLLCEESYEMINTVKLAMDFDAGYTKLRDQVFTHPTMTEALNDLFAG